MKNVSNERRMIMLSCTEISFGIPFFVVVEEFGVKPGFPSCFFNLPCIQLFPDL